MTKEEIQNKYPKGTIIKCISMDDPRPVPTNTIGVVEYVDDACQIHVCWNTGSGLALIPGWDEFEIVEPQSDEDCAKAIETACTNNCHHFIFESEEAIDDVLEHYPRKQVEVVVAKAVQHKCNSGRFSKKVSDYIKKLSSGKTEALYTSLGKHPLLDMFATSLFSK